MKGTFGLDNGAHFFRSWRSRFPAPKWTSWGHTSRMETNSIFMARLAWTQNYRTW